LQVFTDVVPSLLAATFYRIFQPFAKFNADCLGHRQASIDYPNKTDFLT
jgi:hypothetical protein